MTSGEAAGQGGTEIVKAANGWRHQRRRRAGREQRTKASQRARSGSEPQRAKLNRRREERIMLIAAGLSGTAGHEAGDKTDKERSTAPGIPDPVADSPATPMTTTVTVTPDSRLGNNIPEEAIRQRGCRQTVPALKVNLRSRYTRSYDRMLHRQTEVRHQQSLSHCYLARTMITRSRLPAFPSTKEYW